MAVTPLHAHRLLVTLGGEFLVGLPTIAARAEAQEVSHG